MNVHWMLINKILPIILIKTDTRQCKFPIFNIYDFDFLNRSNSM